MSFKGKSYRISFIDFSKELLQKPSATLQDRLCLLVAEGVDWGWDSAAAIDEIRTAKAIHVDNRTAAEQSAELHPIARLFSR